MLASMLTLKLMLMLSITDVVDADVDVDLDVNVDIAVMVGVNFDGVLPFQADYDARAVGKTPPSHEHRNIRLLSPGMAEDEASITGLLQVKQENTSVKRKAFAKTDFTFVRD